ncbi:MAG: ABC-three component system protein [Clostridium butyricum]|nr:ABC-three component system protein [Clostridium butyricum]
MGVLEEHSVPGQAAGYFFQPERALYWLAKSPKGAMVGIEAGDDVTVLTVSGAITEQDKSSISKKTDTLGNRSKDLWNTLSIWIQAINEGEINIESTSFIVASNKIFDETYIIRKISNAENDEKAKECIDFLRTAGDNPPKTIEAYVRNVLSCKESILINLIKKTHLSDGNDKSYGNQLMDEISSLCHIPESLPCLDIVYAMLGWLHETVLTLWRNGESGWIARNAFDEQLERQKTIFRERVFRERIPDLIPITNSKREEKKDSKFVRQISLVKDNDMNLIIESIDDFIRANIERNRLSLEGFITEADFITFDDNLKARWRNIFRNMTIDIEDIDSSDPDYEKKVKRVGYKILLATLDYREQLAGRLTEQYYLTKGSYHRHAEMDKIWWHPFYDKLILKSGGENDEK